MYNSKYYTCEQIDQRLLEGYYDDAVAAGYTGTKAQYLAGLLKAINHSAKPMAEKVIYNPSASGLSSKNVKSALDELVRKFNDGLVDIDYALEGLENKIGDRVVVEGKVTNLPDDEDLTSVSTEDGREVIKLNDRAYDPIHFSGKGYKILRKNIQRLDLPTVTMIVSNIPSSSGDIAITINGKTTTITLDVATDTTTDIIATKICTSLRSSIDDYDVYVSSNTIILTRNNSQSATPSSIDVGNTTAVIYVNDSITKSERKNVLTQEMISKPNTIYEIRYDFDLDGATIEIKDNCVLKFTGGSISNGILNLNATILEGNNGLLCSFTSDIPVRTSICGISKQMQADSSSRLSELVNNNIDIIVDTHITCLNPVISKAKRFHIVGDLSVGYSKPAYTISFPSSEGFVLENVDSSASTRITFGHCFRNLNIISSGTCINFWPENHIGVFAENTFENLYLESATGDCVNFGDNYTDKYKTAGFNQYFRQIKAKAVNGACFRNVSANILIWDHITIYGNKDGGFYNCSGFYNGVIFDQAHQEIGWKWENKPDSGVVINFTHCHFENLKYAIDADNTFNGSFYFNAFYADTGKLYDDPEDNLKHFFPISLGRARLFSFISCYLNVSGGDFAKGYSKIKYDISAINLGNTIVGTPIGYTYVNDAVSVGLYDTNNNIVPMAYTNTEFSKIFASIKDAEVIKRLEVESIGQIATIDFTIENEFIKALSCRTILINDITPKLRGYSGYQPPFGSSKNKIFEWDIINKSSSSVKIIHRDTSKNNIYGELLFSSFTGHDLEIPPACTAHCLFNTAQTRGDIIANKFLIEVTSLHTLDSAGGSLRPKYPFVGYSFFDTSLKKNIWWDGDKWITSEGYNVSFNTKGSSSERPLLGNDEKGFQYYDITLKKYIVWNGTEWTNMDGTAL